MVGRRGAASLDGHLSTARLRWPPTVTIALAVLTLASIVNAAGRPLISCRCLLCALPDCPIQHCTGPTEADGYEHLRQAVAEEREALEEQAEARSDLERLAIAAWGLRYFLTADLCAQQVGEALGRAMLKEQRDAARISGVVNQAVMYRAGMLVHTAERAIKETMHFSRTYRLSRTAAPWQLILRSASCHGEECSVPEQYDVREDIFEEIRAGTLRKTVEAAGRRLTRAEIDAIAARTRERASSLDIPPNK